MEDDDFSVEIKDEDDQEKVSDLPLYSPTMFSNTQDVSVSLDVEPVTPEPNLASHKGFWDEAAKGAVKSVAPWALSKEELNKTSGAEIAGQVTTDIATALGAAALGAKAGAALGTAVAPGAGTLVGGLSGAALGALSATAAWGTYKGISGEVAMSKAQDRDVSLANIGLGIAVEVNPATKGTRLALAGRQAILQAAQTYSQTGSAEGAGVAGLIGGALMGLSGQQQEWVANWAGPMVAAGKAPHAEEIMAMIKAAQSGDGNASLAIRALDIAEKLGKEHFEVPERIKTMIAKGESTVLPEDEDFIRFMKSDSKLKLIRKPDDKIVNLDDSAIEENLQGYSPEIIAKSWASYQFRKIQADLIETEVEIGKRTLGGIQDPMAGTFTQGLTPALYVGRKVDFITGANLEGVFASFAEARSRHTVAMSGFLNDFTKVVNKAKKLGISQDELGKAHVTTGGIFKDDGTMEVIGPSSNPVWNTDKGKALLADSRAIFARARQYMIDMGHNVNELENYFPQLAKDPAHFVQSMRQEFKRLKTNDPDLDINANPEAYQLLRALTYLKDPKHGELLKFDEKEIPELINSVMQPKNYKGFLGFEGSAYFTRTGDMPGFIRDYNYGRVAVNYLNGNFKAIHYREPFQELNAQLALVRGFGLDKSAAWVLDYAKKLSGNKSEFNLENEALSQRLKLRGLELGEEAEALFKGGDKIQGAAVYTAAKAQEYVGDVMSWAVGNFYQNVLGWNLAGIIRNSTQTLAVTAPELGGTWGYAAVSRGFSRSLIESGKLAKAAGGRTAKEKFSLALQEKKLQELGLAGGNLESWSLGAKTISNALRDIPYFGRMVEAVDFLGKVGMWVYNKTEIANRWTTYWTGHEVARDILSGKASSLEFVKKMSAGGQAAVYKAIKEGNEEVLGDALGRYLINKTIFNYGPEALMKWGRDWGRMVSMFSMWPTMVGAGGAELMKRKNMKGIRDRMAPFAALMLANLAINEMDDETKKARKFLIGQSLVDIHPVSAMLSISTPPVLTAITDSAEVLKAATQGEGILMDDLSKVGKKAFKLIAPYMPGGYLPIAYNRYDRIFGD